MCCMVFDALADEAVTLPLLMCVQVSSGSTGSTAPNVLETEVATPTPSTRKQAQTHVSMRNNVSTSFIEQ